MKTIKELEVIYKRYDDPYAEGAVEAISQIKALKDVLGLITCCCRHCEELKKRING